MITTIPSRSALLLLCSALLALPGSAQVVGSSVRATPNATVLGVAVPSLNVSASALSPVAVAALPTNAPLASAIVPAPVASVVPLATPVKPAAPATRATPVAAQAVRNFSPTAASVAENVSGETLTAPGRRLFDQSASREDGSLSVTASAQASVATRLKSARASAPSLASVPALAAVATTAASNDLLIPLIIIGAFFVGVLLLLRWSKKNLEEMTREEIAEFNKLVDAKRPEWLKIPGVVSVEVFPMARMDDTPPAYVIITVDHLGPDNMDLLPQRDDSFGPVIDEMISANKRLSGSDRIGSLNDGGYWPIGIQVRR